MPSFTPNFSLPYPGPSDAPCDFAAQWCDFTAAIDAVLEGFELVANRTSPVIPIALLKSTVSILISSDSNIPFDSVIVDTAGMTDMDVDPFGITVKRPGRYTIAGCVQALTASPPFPPGFFGMSIVGGTSTINASTFDYGVPGLNLGVQAEQTVQTLEAGDQVRLSFSFGTLSSFQINQAWLAVFWHSDTERAS